MIYQMKPEPPHKRSPELVSLSKFLSKILRHNPGCIGIQLDKNGWANVDELLIGINKTRQINMDILEEIVQNDEKKRYSFNEDKTKIRANQGHTIQVDVELEEAEPPQYLLHGTGKKYMDSIDKNGLIAKDRLYVHLSTDYDTALAVGRRHGKPIVYRINTREMVSHGFRFYKSVNDVWLTKYVPAIYLTKEEK